MGLIDRTLDACNQLTRYGNAVFCDELADVLDTVTDINDNMHHDRDKRLIVESIEKAKQQLDALAASLKGE